jgi:polyisoprenyl-phosphate glycosyltransferase
LSATIDVIIPFFNEAQSAPELCKMVETLFAAFAARSLSAKLILIDDGSTDNGADLFQRHCKVNATIVELSRNFGKEIAVFAGIDSSAADIVLIMDADLQHTTEMALDLTDALLADDELDVVYARRNDRARSGHVASWSAESFYRMINWGQRYSFPKNAGDFRVMRRPVADALKALRDQRRFNKGLYAFAGFRQKAINYEPAKREAGASNWTNLQLLVYSLSTFTSFSIVPLRILSLSGLACALFGLIYGIKIIFEVLFSGIAVPGYPSLLVAVILFGGLNIALLGLIGEYVWVGILEGKNRPVYITRSTREIAQRNLVKSGKTQTKARSK